MMKLFYGTGTCSLVDHIVLRRTGQPFELYNVDLKNGEQTTEAFKKFNPHGRVPALDLGDGRMLTESTVIAQYLAETYPQAAMIPADPFHAYMAKDMMAWANTTLHAETFATIFRPHRFTDDEDVKVELTDYGREKLPGLLSYAEGRIATRDWGAPDEVTLADLYLYVYGRWAKRIGVPLTGYPAYTALMERVDALPETQAALEEEGL